MRSSSWVLIRVELVRGARAQEGTTGRGNGVGRRNRGKTTVLIFQITPYTFCLSFLWVLFSFIFLFYI